MSRHARRDTCAGICGASATLARSAAGAVFAETQVAAAQGGRQIAPRVWERVGSSGGRERARGSYVRRGRGVRGSAVEKT